MVDSTPIGISFYGCPIHRHDVDFDLVGYLIWGEPTLEFHSFHLGRESVNETRHHTSNTLWVGFFPGTFRGACASPLSTKRKGNKSGAFLVSVWWKKIRILDFFSTPEGIRKTYVAGSKSSAVEKKKKTQRFSLPWLYTNKPLDMIGCLLWFSLYWWGSSEAAVGALSFHSQGPVK